MVKKINETYRCSVCGNIINVAHVGGGDLVCCGQPMELLKEQTAKDEGKEKHVPVIERDGNIVTVKVGSVPHPMIDTHYIEWIEIITKEQIQRKFLKPGDAPEATFETNAEDIIAREYCNVHGLWTSK